MGIDGGMTSDPTSDPRPQATLGRTALSGGAWSVLGRTLPLVYTFFVSVVAARALGPTVMGQLALITFGAASATVILAHAPGAALMRTIGEARGRGNDDAIRALVRPSLAVAAVLAGVVVALSAVLALLAETNRLAWLLAGVWAATTILHSVPSGVLAGVQRWREAVIVGLTTGVVHVAVSVAVLAAGGGITELLAVDAAVGATNLIGTGLLARRLIRRLPRPGAATPDLAGPAARFALATTPAVLLAFVLERRSELFFLALFASSAQIALYAIPFSALSVLALVPTALGVVTATTVATLVGSGAQERIRAGHERAVRLTLLLALPLTAVGATVGPELLHLVYGEGYGGARPVLVILVVALPLIVVTSLEVALLQGLRRAREQVLVYAWAGAANVALALAFVPRLDAIGAAVAHSGAYVVGVLAADRYARRALGPISHGLRALLPVTAASVGTAAATLGVLALVDGVAAGVGGLAAATAVFLLLARVLRVLPREDATWLAGHYPGRTARAALALSRPYPHERAAA